ncbi:MAG: CBU_0592 family membrane protein [Pseudomarimonas sp.]
MSAVDWVASVGSATLLLAFFLVQRGVLAAQSTAYLLLNLVGSAIAALAAWMGHIIPFVVLEVVWAAVAAWGLWTLWRRRQPSEELREE